MTNVSPLLAAAFFLVLAWMLLRIVRYGSWRGALFGASIQRTVGEVEGVGALVTNNFLRVHVLDGPPDKAIGIEIVAKSLASYQMLPITLSLTRARILIDILQSATAASHPSMPVAAG